MRLLAVCAAVFVLGACGFKSPASGDDDHPGDGGDDDGGGSGSGSGSGSATGPCGTLGAIRDDFSSGAILDQWSVVSSAHVAQANGTLTITPDAVSGASGLGGGGQASLMGVISQHAVDMSNDAFTVEVPGMVDTAATNAAGVVYLSAGNGRYCGMYQQHGKLVVVSNVTGTGMATSVSVDYDAMAHKWWRIADDGTNVSFQVSPDGTTWTPLGIGSFATPTWIKRVRISLEGSSDGAHGSVVFDNLNLTTPAAPWCKPGALVDTFGRTLIGDDWDGFATKSNQNPYGCLPSVNAGAHFDQSGGNTGRCWLETEQAFDLTNSYATVDVPAITMSKSGFNTFFRAIADDITDAFLIGFSDDGTTKKLCAQLHSDTPVCTTYNAATMEYWRLGQSSAGLSFEYSQDKATWTPIPGTPLVIDATVAAQMTAIQFEVGTEATATWSGGAIPLLVPAYNSGL